MTSASKMAPDDTSLEERIRERAYDLWTQAGHEHGRAEEFWYQAELEIRGEMDGSQETMASTVDGSAVDQLIEDYIGGESGEMGPGTDASLASDEGVEPAAAEKPKRPRKAPAKKADVDVRADDVGVVDAAAEKPRRGRRPAATP